MNCSIAIYHKYNAFAMLPLAKGIGTLRIIASVIAKTIFLSNRYNNYQIK